MNTIKSKHYNNVYRRNQIDVHRAPMSSETFVFAGPVR